METWQLDFEWLRVRTKMQEEMGLKEPPDLNAVLLLIGVNELGVLKEDWSKEEKQDLMHIAVCRLLSEDGHYQYVGLDGDAWPHYKQLTQVPVVGVKNQEQLLIQHAITYIDQAFG
jgi:hypothetical protein